MVKQNVNYTLTLKDLLTPKITGATVAVAELETEMRSLLVSAGLAFGLFEAFSFGGEAIKSVGEYNTAFAELENALINTAGVSGQTMTSLKELNEQIFFHSEFTREDIAQTEKLLLASKNIRGEIYEKTLPVISDLAAFMKTDMATGSKVMARALNDPVNGIMRLRILVPGLTKAMVDHIAVTEKNNGLVAAQKELLNDVSSATKGAAEIALKNDPFALMQKHAEELKISLGGLLISGLKRIRPYILSFLDSIKNSVEWLRNHKAILYGVAAGITSVATALVAYKTVMLATTIAGWAFQAMELASLIATDGLTAALYAAGIAGTTMWAAITLGGSLAIAGIVTLWHHLDNVEGKMGKFTASMKAAFYTMTGQFAAADTVMMDWYKKNIASTADQRRHDFLSDPNNIKKFSGTKRWTELLKQDSDWKAAGSSGISGADTSLETPASSVTGSKPTNIYLTINSLIKELNINTQNLKESTGRIKEEIIKVLVEATTDASIIAGQ